MFGAAHIVQGQPSLLPTGTPDGPLALWQFHPPNAPPNAPPQVLGHVVVAPALGVAQRYYAPFAAWLAAQGWVVTTFDYSGHAASRHRRKSAVQVQLLDWAQDCQRVAQHVARQAGALPVLWLGHSVGAQLPSFAPQPLPIDGMVLVASGSGYWRENAAPTRRKVHGLWWALGPVLTALCGYFPGKAIGVVGDLPRGVFWQWRRWCLHPHYAQGAEAPEVAQRPAAVRYPLHALVMEDDEMMSVAAIASLLRWHSHAPHRVQSVPAQLAPGGRIGHLGFFRAQMASALWPLAHTALLHMRTQPVPTVAPPAADMLA